MDKITNFLNNIGLYTSKQYNDKIKEFEDNISILDMHYAILSDDYDKIRAKLSDSEQLYSKAITTIDKLESELYSLKFGSKHYSLETFKEYLDENIKPVQKYHSDINGKFRPSRKLRYTQQDEAFAWDFLDNIMEFQHDFYGTKDADYLVYAFNKEFNMKYPASEYYITDEQNYGNKEVWASFSMIYTILKKKQKLDDCDGFMVFKYVCLYLMLKKYFPEDTWRLRGFVTVLRGSGKHALLAWIKGGNMNDWIHIETTYREDLFVSDWNRDLPLNKQALYDIEYSFDQDNEYIKLE